MWADLGSGTGAFTLALADLLGPDARIYSVDQNRSALREQEAALRARFPASDVRYLVADLTQPLPLPPLDGVLLANSLHYQRDQEAVLRLLRTYLVPGGRLLLVEYNADKGNPWVPYPISWERWQSLADRAGFAETRLLATRPSRYLREMYSAVSVVAG